MTTTRNETTSPKFRFDPTVNLGHLITFGGILATGVVMWTDMDKRVTLLDVAAVAQTKTDQRQDNEIAEVRRTAHEEVRIVADKLDRHIETAHK